MLAFGCTPLAAADQALIDAAKKEGEVIWYTTQIINQLAQPMAAAFKKTYGIEVKYVRTNANELVLRVLNEGKAGRVQADVIDGTSSTPLLRAEGLIEPYLPESMKRLSSNYHDKDSYWVATNIYIITPGYNTELVKKGTEPKSFDDLLDPKWKGKLVWNSSPSTSGGPGFIGLVLNEMGPEKGRDYLKRLSAQNIVGLGVSARQVLDQVIAGEHAVALQIFNNHALISAAKGAPSAWIPMSPSLALFSVASVVKASPHPNAAKLFLDFLVSEDGQKVYRDAEYMPVDPKYPPNDPTLLPEGGKFRVIYFTPEKIEAEMPEWVKIYRELFR
jgi:iron(III) transport system substrate-binding protein